MRMSICVLLALIGFAPADAATLSFSGSFSQQNPPSTVTGRCAPVARTVTFGPTIAPVSGVSSLGSFLPAGSHCINPATGSYFDGVFSFDFGLGDILAGVYSGALTPTSNPMQFSNVQTFSATGGTGRFAGASGAFTGTGTVTFARGTLPSSFETFAGSIDVPAVPEQSTWAMMIGGMGVVGAVMRRKRQTRWVRC